MLFSDNNHWKFGWGSGLYNFHEQHLPLWVTFGPCRYEPKAFDIEMAVAARKIANSTTKPIYVAMSGGIDSELIGRILLREKIPFTPLIAKFENNYNKSDIDYSLYFCRKVGLTPEVLPVEIVKLIENAPNTPYVMANCAHLLQMHLMRHAASLGGIAIIGCGEQRYEMANETIVTPITIHRISKTHFMQAENVEGVCAFYCYTPELMLSFLREAIAHGFENMSNFGHNIKADVYKKYFPDLLPRVKQGGFARVRPQRKIAEEALLAKYGAMIATVRIPVDVLEKQLSVVQSTQTST